MDDGRTAVLIVSCMFLGLWVMQSKQITRMQREIDLLVRGDLETLKLRRKLDGYPDDGD